MNNHGEYGNVFKKVFVLVQLQACVAEYYGCSGRADVGLAVYLDDTDQP